MSDDPPSAEQTEYFIRTPESEETRGAYTLDQLETLAEAKKIDRDTLIYLDKEEKWLAIGAAEGLRDRIFPKKEAVKLKLASRTKPENQGDDSEDEDEAVSVEKMLADAEGTSEETKYLKRKEKERQKASSISTTIVGFSFLIMAASIVVPLLPFITNMPDGFTWQPILLRPLVFVAIFDAIIAIMILLSVVELFPVARFRAMLGLGFFGYFLWSLQGFDYAAAHVVFAIGIMICTWTLRLPWMLVGGVLSIGSSAYLMYAALLSDLVKYLEF